MSRGEGWLICNSSLSSVNLVIRSRALFKLFKARQYFSLYFLRLSSALRWRSDHCVRRDVASRFSIFAVRLNFDRSSSLASFWTASSPATVVSISWRVFFVCAIRFWMSSISFSSSCFDAIRLFSTSRKSKVTLSVSLCCRERFVDSLLSDSDWMSN